MDSLAQCLITERNFLRRAEVDSRSSSHSTARYRQEILKLVAVGLALADVRRLSVANIFWKTPLLDLYYLLLCLLLPHSHPY